MQESGRSPGSFRRERPVPGNRLYCGPSVQSEKDLCKKAGGPADRFARNGPRRGTACTAGRVRRVKRTYARKRVVSRFVSQGTPRAGKPLAGLFRRERPVPENRLHGGPSAQRMTEASGGRGRGASVAVRQAEGSGSRTHAQVRRPPLRAGRRRRADGPQAHETYADSPSAGAATGSPERRQTLINRSDGPYSVS